MRGFARRPPRRIPPALATCVTPGSGRSSLPRPAQARSRKSGGTVQMRPKPRTSRWESIPMTPGMRGRAPCWRGSLGPTRREPPRDGKSPPDSALPSRPARITGWRCRSMTPPPRPIWIVEPDRAIRFGISRHKRRSPTVGVRIQAWRTRSRRSMHCSQQGPAAAPAPR